MNKLRIARLILASALLSSGLVVRAQDSRKDVLRLSVYFERNVSVYNPDFHDNRTNLRQFREAIEASVARGGVVDSMVMRGAASPEGPSLNNQRLSEERSHALDAWLRDSLKLNPSVFHYVAVGEDWDGLARIIRTLDVPWRDEVVSIIENTPIWVKEGGKVVDSRKNRVKRVEKGAAWRYLDENVFPDLRNVGSSLEGLGGSSIECVISYPDSEPSRTDTVYVRDTIYIERPPQIIVKEVVPDTRDRSLADRRMIFALRTNALAVPFANFGVELPLGRHWSVGADLYYPWIWRPAHRDGVDENGVCNELMALDVEARFWFNNYKKREEQRLLGHSVGMYAAAGHYDFERHWSGNQGEFYDFGVDYLYAAPIFRGRMHIEFELGLGIILAESRPYDCFTPGGEIFHRAGVTNRTTWAGPTRAQVSLVLPIYVRTKKVKEGGMQ